MFENLLDGGTPTTILLVISAAAAVFFGFKFGDKVEDRHRKAAKDSATLTEHGVPFLPALLENYAFHDWTGVARSIFDAVKTIHNPVERAIVFDQFLRVQLQSAGNDASRAKKIAEVISGAPHVLQALSDISKTVSSPP